MKNKIIFNISFTGIMIALGLILPFLTGQIPEIGAMLCPMHIPVFICGLICGWKYGLIAGILTPVLRSMTFGMPPLYPTAVSMSFELATYGFTSGLLFQIFKKLKFKYVLNIYITLIISMLLGRVVWGIVRYIISIFDGSNLFNMKIFVSGAFISAWPGILLQLILIPSLIFILVKTKLLNEIND